MFDLTLAFDYFPSLIGRSKARDIKYSYNFSSSSRGKGNVKKRIKG